MLQTNLHLPQPENLLDTPLKHRILDDNESSAPRAGVDTLLIAVLNSPEIASALEEAGISAKQMAASVEELRGSSAKVLPGSLILRSGSSCAVCLGQESCY
jgi:hypothetical protein